MAEPPLPPTQSPTFINEPNLNVAVIVAAMLCAFLCALGLNSMLRCVFQCTRRMLTEPVQWVAARRVNSGLKRKDMVALPISTYAAANLDSISCAICLLEFSDGERIRVLPKCNHRFHVGCIDKWLLSRSSCPTCRFHLKSNSSLPCFDLKIVTGL